MSKISFFALRDVKIDSYVMPFCAGSPAAASRALSYMLDPDSAYARFPEDFTLYHLADVDVDSGQVMPMSAPQYVCGLAPIVRGELYDSVPVARDDEPTLDVKGAEITDGAD